MQQNEYTLYQLWARRLIGCYPACWRERYAEEMLLVLENSQPTFNTILNLFINLFDAYFHQNLIKGRTPYMLQRMRSNEITIYGATLIFFFAWFLVQLHFIDPAHHVIFRGFSSSYSLLTNIVSSISLILPLFILLGGLPILLAACWQALKKREFRALLLCLLSLISPIAVVVIAMARPYTWLFTPFSVLIGLGISVAFIAYAVQKISPSQRITHYALSLATLLPLVMFIGLAALMFKVFPAIVALAMAGDSLLYVIREDLLIFIMLGTLILALISLKKGFQAKQAMQNIQ